MSNLDTTRMRLLVTFAAALSVLLVARHVFGADAGIDPPDGVPGVAVTSDLAELSAKFPDPKHPGHYLSYSEAHRDVPFELKKQIFLRDLGRVPTGTERKKWEIDHRIPKCAGGADTSNNLWAQLNFRKKDQAEARACETMLRGNVTPDTVQRLFMGPWEDAYYTLMGHAP